jgi:fused signal recognition particle receptor
MAAEADALEEARVAAEEARVVEEARMAAEAEAVEEARVAAEQVEAAKVAAAEEEPRVVEEARMAAEAEAVEEAVEEARVAAEQVEVAAEVEAAEQVRVPKEVKVAAARGVSAGVDPLSSLSSEDRRYLALKLTDYSRESFRRLRGGYGSSAGRLRQAAERRRAPPGDGTRRGWQPASDGARTRGVTMEMAARPASAQAVAARERLLADLEQFGAGPGCKAAPSAPPPASAGAGVGVGAGAGALFAGGAASTALTLLSAGAALAGARAVLEGSRLERERRELEQEREEQREREQQRERERENGGERGDEPYLASPALLMQLQLAEALAAARQNGAALRDALLAREAGIAAAEERAELAEAAKSRLTLGYAAAAAAKEEELAAAQLRLFEQAERLEAGRRVESAGLVAPQRALP